MGLLRTRHVTITMALIVALVAGLGYVLVDAHRTAEQQIRENFDRRTAFAANTTGGLMAGSGRQNQATLGHMFDVPADRLRSRVDDYEHWAGMPTPGLVVLDARGRALLVADRHAAPPLTPILRRARDGRPTTSDLILGRGEPLIATATPVRTHEGRRVVVDTSPASILPNYINGYLRAGPAVPGAIGTLVDGAGRVLASSNGRATGTRARGLADGRRTGFTGDRYVAVARVRGTNWRVVFDAPKAGLLAPVDGQSRRASILLFTAFVAALLAAGLLTVRTSRRGAQLVASRERERAAAELAHERLHDALTHLPNRNLFADRVAQALAGMSRGGSGLAIVFIDLDRFKLINDSLGHGHGDDLLRTVALRLTGALRPDDTLSRFGGDEFVVLARGITGERDALRVAERVLRTLADPFELGPRTVRLTGSAGIVVHLPGHAPMTPADLVRAADVAMYRAKDRGPGSLELFDEEMHRRAVSRLDLELALRDALTREELLLHYQPIVTLPAATLHGVEALVRWERPGIGLVPPGEFIGLAEESELIVGIGAWVLRRATADLARWRADGTVPPDCSLSVNLSTRQLFCAPIVATVRDALRDSGLPPAALCLEITESVMMEDADRAILVLEELKTLGVTLSIDDFGVGHSSLEQLGRMLPVDQVKLDRTFVDGMTHERDRAIVATVAALSRELRLAAVAEGIETPEQLRACAALGYPLGQGFLFGRPLPTPAVDAAALNAAVR